VVAPHAPLVDEAREAAGPRQHAEERHLGQRHRGGAVVDEQDLVAGERELVAAAGRGTVKRAQRRDARLTAHLLEVKPGLVRELAEVHLERVRALPEHLDVRAGGEDPVAQRRDHEHAHLGMREAQPLERVGELDVDAEIVRVELQGVAGREASALVDAHPRVAASSRW